MSGEAVVFLFLVSLVADDPVVQAPADERKLAEPSKDERSKYEDEIKRDAGELEGLGPAVTALRLAELGRDTTRPPAYRFLAYTRAVRAATEGGEVALAGQIIGEWAARFEIDALAEKSELLDRLGGNNALRREAALDLALDAFCDDSYELLNRALRFVPDGIERAHLIRSWREIKRRFEQLRKAGYDGKNLQTDAKARFELGKFEAFVKGRWKSGFRMLADNGVHVPLGCAAERDLAGPASALEMVRLADEWERLLESGLKDDLDALERRAAFWYYRAAARSAHAGLSEEDLKRAQKGGEALVRNSRNKQPWEDTLREAILSDAVLMLTFDLMSYEYGLVQDRTKCVTYMKDMSGRGNRARVQGALPSWGKGSGALEFEEKKWVEGDAAPKDFPGGDRPRALIVCVRPEERIALRRTLFAYGDRSGGNAFELCLERMQPVMYFDGVPLLRGSSTLRGGKRYRVGCVYEGGGCLEIYVDGNRVGRSASSAKLNAPCERWRVGKSLKDKSPAHGWIDEVILFDRALSRDEIRFLFERVGDSGMSARYRLE